jgi:hypothetical protein
MRNSHIAVVPPDHRFELRDSELLLHSTGGMAVRAEIIFRAKRGELLLDDRKKLVGRGRKKKRSDALTIRGMGRWSLSEPSSRFRAQGPLGRTHCAPRSRVRAGAGHDYEGESAVKRRRYWKE